MTTTLPSSRSLLPRHLSSALLVLSVLLISAFILIHNAPNNSAFNLMPSASLSTHSLLFYAIVCLPTSRRVAIKRIMVSSLCKISLAREISCLRCLNHRNVLKFLDCFPSGDLMSIVTEEVPYTLSDIISDQTRPKTEDFNRWFYTQILAGIAYIHSKDIMHRDIKPENILVTSRNIIKIADFGQACFYLKKDQDHEYDVNVATRWYRAPELLFGSRKYTPDVDIWAIGCILAELIRGKPMFPGRSELEQISIIFGVLGTPNQENWPNWRMMPDANKLLFEPKEPRNNWTEILLCKEAPKEFIDFLCQHLRFTRRTKADKLLKQPWIRNGLPLIETNYRVLKRSSRRNQRDALPPLHIFI